MNEQKKAVRSKTGIVVSDKMQKTIVVLIVRKVKSRIGKYVLSHTKLMVHDQDEIAKIGDKVTVCESRPYSKKKSWTLLRVDIKGRS